jgi:hypothetical protein
MKCPFLVFIVWRQMCSPMLDIFPITSRFAEENVESKRIGLRRGKQQGFWELFGFVIADSKK